jgi:hypothetical protein
MSVPVTAAAAGLGLAEAATEGMGSHEAAMFLVASGLLGGGGVPGDQVPATLPCEPHSAGVRLLSLRSGDGGGRRAFVLGNLTSLFS